MTMKATAKKSSSSSSSRQQHQKQQQRFKRGRKRQQAKRIPRGYPRPIDEDSSLDDEEDGEFLYNNEYYNGYDDDNDDQLGLISGKRRRPTGRIILVPSKEQQQERLRPYWLGAGLFLTLFAFWVLDSLKDPIFALLVDGNLDQHQPPAKLCSVATTLVLVCLLEFISNHAASWRQQQQQQQQQDGPQETYLGLFRFNKNARSKHLPYRIDGPWNRMDVVETKQQYYNKQQQQQQQSSKDNISVSAFFYLGTPYIIVFAIIAYILHTYNDIITNTNQEKHYYWYMFGYALYAIIESFGSLAVATFWSYTNSTLSLDDAEQYYGPIIAIAQLGAIGGSTMVAYNTWSNATLMILCCLVIVLQILVMIVYGQRYKPTSVLWANPETLGMHSSTTSFQKSFWSGLYLIVRHYYVILLLGVSCLYEVSLTCLDYQMKLLGWKRFEETTTASSSNSSIHEEDYDDMNFAQFMGHYGQVVNITSFVFSSICFPWLIQFVGVRQTLRLFPTLLLVATIVAYGAMPGNLTVLFFSMSILKAMTYSIHDPSKEILYIPTSNAIKFKSKFWIDVVGARISKAIGSGINTYAGSVDRSVRVGTIPSLLTVLGLWVVCYLVGIEFDRLLVTGKIVGLERDTEGYQKVATREKDDDIDNDDDDHGNDGDDEVVVLFEKPTLKKSSSLPIPPPAMLSEGSSHGQSDSSIEMKTFHA